MNTTSIAVPPGPRSHFLLGHLPDFRRDILGFMLANARDYGPVTRLSLAGKPAYLLTDPQDIEIPLVSNHRNFIKNRFFWRHVEAVAGQGLLVSEGDFWRRQRRLASPAFHGQKIASYANVMVSYTLGEMESWRDGDERDFHHDMMSLTSKIVAKTLFDEDVTGDVHTVAAAMDIMTTEIADRIRRPYKIPSWWPSPGNLRYMRAVRQIDEIVYRFIKDHRRAGGERHTLLSMLMQAKDEDGSGMSDQQLRDESITLFLAGHETTAIALSWTIYLLSQHPEVESRLAAELETVLEGREPAFGDLSQLRYTDAVVRESMRIYPPAYMIGRESVEPCEIGGYAIEPGATIFISPWVQHRQARFFPDPDAFRPERWLDGLEKRLPRFAYMPFGGGPRTCIGDRFAIMEAVLLLAAIVQRWTFHYLRDAAPTPFPSVTLRPQEGVPVRLGRR
jgi:cytochrome P450